MRNSISAIFCLQFCSRWFPQQGASESAKQSTAPVEKDDDDDCADADMVRNEIRDKLEGRDRGEMREFAFTLHQLCCDDCSLSSFFCRLLVPCSHSRLTALLARTVGVEGQVKQLIHDATNEENLAHIFRGWSAWL